MLKAAIPALSSAILAASLTAKAQDTGFEPIDAVSMRAYMEDHYEGMQVQGGVSLGVGAVGVVSGAYLLLNSRNPVRRNTGIPLLTYGAAQVVVGSLLLNLAPNYKQEAGEMLTNDPSGFYNTELSRNTNMEGALFYSSILSFAILMPPIFYFSLSESFPKTWAVPLLIGVAEGLLSGGLGLWFSNSSANYDSALFRFGLPAPSQPGGSAKPMVSRPVRLDLRFAF